MTRFRLRIVLVPILALVTACLSPVVTLAQSQGEERRIALVIGNGEYEFGPLKTAANDAGLIAQTLQAAGFDVTGARDLDSTTLRDAIREFVDKARETGSETVSFVYFSGRALQFEGENYLLPTDAQITKDSDIPLEGIRLSDLTKPLGQASGKASIVVLDAARLSPPSFPKDGIAGGLALVQPEQGMAIAYNAAPGTVGPDEDGPYSAYATALVEMIKGGDYALDDVFSRARMRVSDLTKGQQLPWYASRILKPFRFFEQAEDAKPEARDKFDDLKSRPLQEFTAEDAYQAALARDTFAAYQEFLKLYPKDPLAKRVRAILAARREAMTWRETVITDTPEAYWSYLRRYPDGPHAYEARRRLAYFDVAYDPPPRFTEIYYDVPPPYEEEIIFIRRRPYVYFGDPYFNFPPPPLISILFLIARPAYYIALPPPPPSPIFILPMPIYYPVPYWVKRPRYVVEPPPSLISINIYNKVEVQRDGRPIIETPKGERIPVRDFRPVVSRDDDNRIAGDKKRPAPDAPLAGVGLPRSAEKKIGRLPKNPDQPDLQSPDGQTKDLPLKGRDQQKPERNPKDNKLPGFGETEKGKRDAINPPKSGGKQLPDTKDLPTDPTVKPDKVKRLPVEEGQNTRDLPKDQFSPKTKDLPKRQQPQLDEQPKIRDLPKRQQPQLDEQPKIRDLPKRQQPQFEEQPKIRDLPKRQQPQFEEQPKIRDLPKRQQPQFDEQPKLREIPRQRDEQPRIREVPRQQDNSNRKKCGKPPLPPCE